jgi:CheY-like chemotaxis protein
MFGRSRKPTRFSGIPGQFRSQSRKGEQAVARVLVVDDNRDLADNVVEILMADGHDAVAEYGGEGALARAQGFPFDAALIDIRMPGMSGVALAKRLMHDHPNQTYLLMTAYADMKTTEEALALGQRAVLDKPLDFELLRRLIPAANGAVS